MKPLKLTMHYFGPYEDTTIDFTRFDASPLYLIAGDTGSGKTTIFDAMCVALYGNASNERRSAEMFRSDFATPKQVTEVTFLFKHKGVTYQVYRRPRQVLTMTRGKGEKQYDPKVSLVYPVGAENPRELTKITEVNQFVQDLLGVNASQFRQLIILPQGEVQRFLMADSKTKEEILTTLFQTQLYTNWVTKLDERAKSMRDQTQDITSQFKVLMGQVDGVSDQLELDQWQVAVGDLLTEKKAELRAVTEQVTTAQKAADQLQAQLTAERRLAEDHAALVSCETQQLELKERAPQIKRLADENEETAWAQQHQTAYHEWQAGTTKLADLTKQQAACEQKQAAVKVRVQELTQVAERLKEQEPAVQERQRQVANIREKLPLFEEVAALSKRLEKERRAQVEQERTVSDQTSALTKLQAELDRVDQELQAAPDLTQAAVTIATRVQQVVRWQQAVTALGEQAKELANQEQALRDLNAQLAEAKKTAQAAQADLKEKKKARLAAMIATLASELEEGEACPICGSTTHPHVATAVQTGQKVTEVTLDAAQAKVTKAETTLATLTTRQANQDSQLEKGRATFQDELATLCQAVASPAGDLEAATAAVAEAVAALDHDRQELQNAQAKETENQQRQVSLTKQIQAGQAKYQELQAAVNEGRLNVNQTQTELVNKQGQLPAELPDLASAERWLKEEEQALADFASQQTQNQDALSRAQTQLTQLTTTSQQLADSAKATAAEVDQRKRELTAALAERQAAWEVFERALARVPELAARQREVNDYRQRLASLADQRQRLVEQIAGRPKSDVEKTAGQLKKAQVKLDQLKGAVIEQGNALTRIKEIKQQVEKKAAKQGDTERQLRELSSLCALLKGQGGTQLGLQRYVQRHYFTEVLAVANQWLAKLTHGRYQMHLDGEADFKGRQNKNGLEIYADDDYAGKARKVQSLSGGESFLTALALALALGEVVQRHHGGVEIEALFVDEGFGSLDQDALGEALDTLQSLDGNRMIGIISHVTELEEQIPDQLQVIAENGRSKVKYHLATD